MSDGGDWQQGRYGDEPAAPPPSAGRGRRRAGNGPAQGGYPQDQASGGRAYGAEAPPAADPYASQAPYGRAPQGYGQPQGYTQPQPQPQYPQGQQQYPQGYGAPQQPQTPPGYDAHGYSTPQPPAAAPPPSASRGGRRAASRTGPKVVQSEVLNSSTPDYGYATPPQDQYSQPHDPYAARTPAADDGWGGSAAGARGYDTQREDEYSRSERGRRGAGGYAASNQGGFFDDGQDDRGYGGRGGDYGRDDDGWDDRGGGSGGGWDDDEDYEDQPRRRGKLRAWAPLIVLLVVLGSFGGCLYGGYSYYKSKFGPAPDYANAICTPATKNKTSVEIPAGASQGKIANILFAAGVVESVSAYTTAANDNQSSQSIQAGTYNICKGISADTAVAQLLDITDNLDNSSRIVVTSGEWVSDIKASLAAKHNWNPADIQAAIDANKIGLPSWAVVLGKPSAEGLLAPGTYQLSSSDTPASILSQMVSQQMAFLNQIDFVQKASSMTCGSSNCTPEQVLTIASMAEEEVRSPAEAASVAEAVFNRLARHDYLGIDATTVYGLQKRGTAPSLTDTNNPSDPYSTGASSGHVGLPPGPIGIPSQDTINAVLKPTTIGAYYWCSKTADGTTQFYKRSQESQWAKACNV